MIYNRIPYNGAKVKIVTSYESYIMHLRIPDLGCDFLTERCTDQSVFPYLCNTSETQLVCTYDHLTKVRMCA